MDKASFRLAYDGPALGEHAMDVRHLSPALLAVGDLCREAHRVINGQRGEVKVLVKANFEERCFDISFELWSLFEQVRQLVRSDDIATAKEILEWLGLLSGTSGLSLWAFLKWKKGRKIINAVQTVSDSHGVHYQITVEGERNSIAISAPVYNLLRDPDVRSAQKRITAPLKLEGFEKAIFKEDNKPVAEITKSEAEEGFYDVVAEEVVGEQKLEPQPIEAILLLRAPVFVPDAKWQFWLGQTRITASIHDDAFKGDVFRHKIKFGVGDRLKVKMTLTQVLTSDGEYRTDYDVTEVIQVIEAPQQLDLLDDPHKPQKS